MISKRKQGVTVAGLMAELPLVEVILALLVWGMTRLGGSDGREQRAAQASAPVAAPVIMVVVVSR